MLRPVTWKIATLVQWRGGQEPCLINALLCIVVYWSIFMHLTLSNAFWRVRRQNRFLCLAPREGPQMVHHCPCCPWRVAHSLGQDPTMNHSRPYNQWCQGLLSPSIPLADKYFSVAITKDASWATKTRRISVPGQLCVLSDCGTETLQDCREWPILTFWSPLFMKMRFSTAITISKN